MTRVRTRKIATGAIPVAWLLRFLSEVSAASSVSHFSVQKVAANKTMTQIAVLLTWQYALDGPPLLLDRTISSHSARTRHSTVSYGGCLPVLNVRI